MTGTTKSRKKNQNARRKGSFKILRNIGSGHHQTRGDERKNKNRILQENEETTGNQTK